MQKDIINIPELDEETINNAFNQIKIPQVRDLCLSSKQKISVLINIC